VVEQVKRASIVYASFDLDKRTSTTYDVGPVADLHEEYPFDKAGRWVLERKRLVLNHLLKLQPFLLLIADKTQSI